MRIPKNSILLCAVLFVSAQNFFGQWLQLPTPPNGFGSNIMYCWSPVAVVGEVSLFGNGKLFYKSGCSGSPTTGNDNRLLLSFDDFQTGSLKYSGSNSNYLFPYGLQAYSDSTFTWFQQNKLGSEACATFNSFKSTVNLGGGGWNGSGASDLTPNYFYGSFFRLKDTFLTYSRKLDLSYTGMYKTGGYNPTSSKKMDFLNDSVGFTILTSASNTLVNTFMTTISYGKTWAPSFVDSITQVIDFQLNLNGDLYLLKTNGQIYFSSDNGNSWTLKSTATATNCTTFNIQSPTTWLVGAVNGVLLKTVDGGITWTTEVSNTTETIQRIYTFGNEGYFVAKDATLNTKAVFAVFKSVLPIGLTEYDRSLGAIVYPNPSEGLFRVTIPEKFMSGTQPVTLTIYDLLGNVLIKKICENSDSDLSLESMRGGIYFLRIACGDLEQTIKLYKTE